MADVSLALSDDQCRQLANRPEIFRFLGLEQFYDRADLEVLIVALAFYVNQGPHGGDGPLSTATRLLRGAKAAHKRTKDDPRDA